MRKIIIFSVCILLTLAVGGLGGIATASGVNDWYTTIQKPSFNPPNYLFGPVWSFLYLLMGISLFIIVQKPKSKNKTNALWAFSIQLILNFVWSFLFFKFQLLGFAFVEIIFIWLSIVAMIFLFRKLDKTAAYLQIPYLFWVSFASVLNGTIWYLNV